MPRDPWIPRSQYGTGDEPQTITIHSPVSGSGADKPLRTQVKCLLGRELQTQVWLSPNGLTSFRSSDGRSSFALTEEQYSMHLLLLGGIGSGKTNVIYHILDSLRQSVTAQDVVIVFDSKGDFWQRSRQYHSRDILIGNSPQYHQNSCYWNIYWEIMGRSFRSYERSEFIRLRESALPQWEMNARALVKGLFQDRRSSTQPFFADAAAALVTIKLLYDLRRGDLSAMNTHRLRSFFKHATVEHYDDLILRSGYPDFASAKQYYGDGTTPQALAVFAYVNSLVDDLFCGVFGDEPPAGGTEFAMGDLVHRKGGQFVFVEYDLSTGAVFSPLYQMLYDQALKQALGRTSSQGNVYLICDELKLLGRLKHLDDGLNFGRSLGVKVCAGLQSVNQIYDLYGEVKGKSMLSGFSNLMCFRTGDAETARFIRDHFGNNYSLISFWREEQEHLHVEREGYCVEHWDVLRLPRGTAVVDLWSPQPYPPFLFSFPRY